MEKFGTWSDKATGVRPFIIKRPQIPTWQLYLSYFIGAVKLIIGLPPLFALIISSYIASFIPITFIRRTYLRVSQIITCNLLLTLLGSYFESCHPAPLINKIFEQEKWRKPRRNTIIFAPLTSVVHLLYMSARFSPLFVIPINATDCVVYSLVALTKAILARRDLRVGRSQKLASIVAQKSDPIVILAESAATNGLGILQYAALNCELPEGTTVKILGFRSKEPTFICENWFLYVLRLFARFGGSLSPVSPLESDTPKTPQKLTGEYVEEVRVVTGKLLHLPLLALTADDARGFINECQKGGKAHQN
jgi:hypothetical protein